MLDARTGAVVRILSPGIRLGAVVVSERLRRAYVLNAGDVEDGRAGSVAILDAMTGRLIRTITVGLHPVGIAVDDVHRRVVVLNDGDSSAWHGACTPLSAGR